MKKRPTKLKWGSARLPDPYYLEVPSFGINRALGGKGLESGRIHTIWGSKASGKTTLVMQMMASAQRDGKECAFIDAEKAWSPKWAEMNGVDIDALNYIRANSAEKILEILLPDLEKGLIDVVVVDSLTSIGFGSYLESPDGNAMGAYARSSKMFTHKVLSALGTQQHVFLISHAAMDLSGFHPMLKAAVGNAIEHWSSTMIKVQKMQGKDHVREDGSFRVKWRIDKSKQSNYPVDGEYFFNPKTAKIDVITELASAAVHDELIDQSGAWFYYNKGQEDEMKWHGEAKLAEEIRENPKLFKEIWDSLNQMGVSVIDEEEDE